MNQLLYLFMPTAISAYYRFHWVTTYVETLQKAVVLSQTRNSQQLSNALFHYVINRPNSVSYSKLHKLNFVFAPFTRLHSVRRTIFTFSFFNIIFSNSSLFLSSIFFTFSNQNHRYSCFSNGGTPTTGCTSTVAWWQKKVMIYVFDN